MLERSGFFGPATQLLRQRGFHGGHFQTNRCFLAHVLLSTRKLLNSGIRGPLKWRHFSKHRRCLIRAPSDAKPLLLVGYVKILYRVVYVSYAEPTKTQNWAHEALLKRQPCSKTKRLWNTGIGRSTSLPRSPERGRSGASGHNDPRGCGPGTTQPNQFEAGGRDKHTAKQINVYVCTHMYIYIHMHRRTLSEGMSHPQSRRLLNHHLVHPHF